MVNFVKGGTRIYSATQYRRPTGSPENRRVDEAIVTADVPPGGDNYLSALLKLIPAEIISIYMAIRDGASKYPSGLGQWFVACLLTCIIFRAYSNLPQKPDSTLKDVQWRSVIVSAIAFFLWAYAIGPEPPFSIGLIQWQASALAALFGILAPLFVPGDPAGK